uniref:PH domain-containing protein n=2 Tax=Mesocestoides corti TaxID=53468 RepID=A0A5K3EXE6_MESCO
MSGGKCIYDSMYETNRAFLRSPGAQSSSSLNVLLLSEDDSLNTTCMVKNNSDSQVAFSNKIGPVEPKTARSISIAVLSRIARHLCISLDALLADILPPPSASESHLSSGPQHQCLVDLGRMAYINLTQTTEHGFVSGVSILDVVQPFALALLGALASWPTKTNRRQLLDESSNLIEDFLSSATDGFPILSQSTQEHVLHLIEFILNLYDSKENLVDSLASNQPIMDKVDASIPFIDESRLFTLTPINKTHQHHKHPQFTECESPFLNECSRLSISSKAVEVERSKSVDDSYGLLNSDEKRLSIPLNRWECQDGMNITTAVQLALLFLPPDSRFQLQVFVEQAQEVIINATHHVNPEKTLYYAQPSALATWFAPRFFPTPSTSNQSPGCALLEFILSCPHSLSLLKSPPFCFEELAERSVRQLSEALEFCHLAPGDSRVDSRLEHVSATRSDPFSPANEDEQAPGYANPDTESASFVPLNARLHTSPYYNKAGPVSSVNCNFKSGATHESDASQEQPTKSCDLERFLVLGNMTHLIHTLNYFINDKTMDPKTKMRYIKQFEQTHPDVFWLRFGDNQTAKKYYAHLQCRIDQSHGNLSRGQSPARLIDRFTDIFKRRHHRSKKRQHSAKGGLVAVRRSLSR